MDAETLRRDITETVQMEFESQVRELRRQKNNAEEELDDKTERWRIERRRLKSEIDKLEEALADARAGKVAAAGWEQEREQLMAQVSQLETSLTQNAAQLEQLRSEYETKIQELALQNVRLRQEFQGGALVAATEVRLVSSIDGSSIEGEMQRVEEMIRAIETLLEHPDTTASMMARKNTEKAEKEAYLQGLSFQLGLSKGA